MQPFPHHYTVAAAAAGPSDVELNAQPSDQVQDGLRVRERTLPTQIGALIV